MKLSIPEIIGAAIIIPILSLVAVQGAKRIWKWLAAAMKRSFAETVRVAVAKDIAAMGSRVGKSIEELRQSNTADHRRVQNRLAEVENAVNSKLNDVEARLASIEERLPLLERRRYVKPPPEKEE